MSVRDYYEGNWSEYEVLEDKKKPTGPHYGAVIFDTYYTDGGYSAAEGGGSYPRPYARYYAFYSQEVLERWVTEASQAKKHFFCFAAKMAEAQVTTTVRF